MVAKKTTTTKAVKPTKKATPKPTKQEEPFDSEKAVKELEKAINAEEKQKTFAEKSIDEMTFDELFTLKGIMQEEVNWLIYCNEEMQMRKNSLRLHSSEWTSLMGSQQQVQEKITRMNDFCTRLHHKITNYILEQWVK